VTQPNDRDGVPTFVRSLALAQRTRSFDVSVACPPVGDLPEKLDADGIPRLDWPAGRDPGPGSVKEAIALKKIVRGWAPDVVHLHSSKAGLAGRLVRPKGPVVVFQPHAWSFEHVHGLVGRAALGWERLGAQRCDAIVCVSEAEKRRGEEEGIGGDLRVIANGVSLDRWTPAGEAEKAEARTKLGLPDDPLVVCIGRLSTQKGQDVLLAAWSDIVRSVPSARLALVGEGPLREELERRLVQGVSLEGASDDVPAWLAAADVVAMPSRWEGMSLSMLETMARGRSLVASDVAGVRETFGDVPSIVPPDDPSALARAIVDRLQDPDLARNEGRRLRAAVEERFSFERTEEAIARLYVELRERQPKS
jgi:glycosyltransferase involved in cell wall biosynthesis